MPTQPLASPNDSDVSYKRMNLFNVQGLLLQRNIFDKDIIRKVLWFKALPGDIFVGSYPRSGSTRAQYVIWALLHEGKPLPDFHTLLTREFPCIEVVDSDTVCPRNGGPRLVKHHLPYAFSPTGPDTKHVVVLRNPLDVCASNFVHIRRTYEGEFKDFFECFVRGEVPFGDYFDHVNSWCEKSQDESVLLLCYEEMVEEPVKAVKTIAEFLGLDAGEERLKKIVEETDLEKTVGGRDHLKEEVLKGTVGCHRQYLSEEQKKVLGDMMKEKIQDGRLKSVWEKLL
ncbi:sulfotransferase 1B1-like isoform X2 [Ornithodoros turicata]|uniref:sulfotransferase 1B1-like isoform X2 n=1 Tax=Ornithodoros turicata TaxID=34597 RepID=UPI0031393BDD